MKTLSALLLGTTLCLQGSHPVLANSPEPTGVQPLSTTERSALETGAEAGNADAQLELGLAWMDGSLGTVDYAQALPWLQKAADKGNAGALVEIGRLHESGTFVPQSYELARSHYEKAVALGSAAGELRLGMLYFDGWGVAKDASHCLELLRTSAGHGYKPAQLILSELLAYGIAEVKADKEEAIKWASLAAADGDPEGEKTLGKRLLRRGRQQEDLQLARQWFLRSANQAYADGMLSMADTFLSKKEVSPEDQALGVRWLELSTENGQRSAPFLLAWYRASKMTGEDEALTNEVRRLLEVADNRGLHLARFAIEDIDRGIAPNKVMQDVLTIPFPDLYVARERALHGDTLNQPTHAPLMIKMIEPKYPRSMRIQNLDGNVMVAFEVDTDGNVRNAQIEQATHPAFVQPALDAVRAWRFIPGRKNGRLVITRLKAPIQFCMCDLPQVRIINGSSLK